MIGFYGERCVFSRKALYGALRASGRHMGKDYIQAYLDALAGEHRLADKAQQAQLEQRLRAACDQLDAPYREAIRLRGVSDALRGRITQGIAQGMPEHALLDLALDCIAAMCGDEAFARHNRAALTARAAAPDTSPDTARADALKREYNYLLTRVRSVMTYAADARVPMEDRQRTLSTLADVQTRMLAVLADLGETTADEAANGFPGFDPES